MHYNVRGHAALTAGLAAALLGGAERAPVEARTP
jgi:hypothetical protein